VRRQSAATRGKNKKGAATVKARVCGQVNDGSRGNTLLGDTETQRRIPQKKMPTRIEQLKKAKTSTRQRKKLAGGSWTGDEGVTCGKKKKQTLGGEINNCKKAKLLRIRSRRIAVKEKRNSQAKRKKQYEADGGKVEQKARNPLTYGQELPAAEKTRACVGGKKEKKKRSPGVGKCDMGFHLQAVGIPITRTRTTGGWGERGPPLWGPRVKSPDPCPENQKFNGYQRRVVGKKNQGGGLSAGTCRGGPARYRQLGG